jgi:hypothetical protein
VAEIVKTRANQSRSSYNWIPWALEIVARLFRIVTGHNVRPDPSQAAQYRQGSSIEDDGLAIKQDEAPKAAHDIAPRRERAAVNLKGVHTVCLVIR